MFVRVIENNFLWAMFQFILSIFFFYSTRCIFIISPLHSTPYNYKFKWSLNWICDIFHYLFSYIVIIASIFFSFENNSSEGKPHGLYLRHIKHTHISLYFLVDVSLYWCSSRSLSIPFRWCMHAKLFQALNNRFVFHP